MARALVTPTSPPYHYSVEQAELHHDASLANLPDWPASDAEGSEDLLSPAVGLLGLLALAAIIVATTVVTLANCSSSKQSTWLIILSWLRVPRCQSANFKSP
jgi:hypothetical protein